ncbi:MAG: PLP-dependent aminotransferase family protein [Lachnospiraceae bacterium]|nr:PLP-dependent aminotransferase family protein [Lachnospiraceae bacterium]
MLTYSFENIGPEPLYMHLYKCIKNDILDGVLLSGTKLPSKRSFAKNLGISNITVENAYAQLQAEGFIYSIPKKGFYVTEFPENMPVTRDEYINSEAGRIAADSIMEEEAKCKIDLVSNMTPPANFPFSIWAKLMREVISEKSSELMKKSPWGGIMELRSAISLHLKQFRNMDVAPEQIITGAGTEYLYTLIIQLLGYNKVYAVENPGYKKVAQIYKSNNVACEYIPVGSSGIVIEELEKRNADVAHISPSHHYPTGIITPVSRRYEILAWASRKKGRYIIEDDYDSEFRLEGKPVPTLQGIDIMESVIYINTFTKSLAPTIRISYMVLPWKLLKVFYNKLSFYSCTVSNFEQYTLARFINNGYFEKHINRMRNYYRNVRDRLMDEIKKSRLSDICEISEEGSGLHFLLKIHTEIPDSEYVEICRQNNINVSCLSQYYIEDNVNYKAYGKVKGKGSIQPGQEAGIEECNNRQHIIIMNYSGIRMEDVKETVSLLCKSSGLTD